MLQIETDRLRLVPCSVAAAQAAMADRGELAAAVGMHVPDGGTGVPAVAVADTQAVVAQFVLARHRRQRLPEVLPDFLAEIQQVGRVLVRDHEQMQAGTTVGKLVRGDGPVT